MPFQYFRLLGKSKSSRKTGQILSNVAHCRAWTPRSLQRCTSQKSSRSGPKTTPFCLNSQFDKWHLCHVPTPPLTRFPPPICPRPVIFPRGSGHRPDQSHFLRPPKLGLEGTLYSTFPPPKSHDTFRPPFAVSQTCLMTTVSSFFGEGLLFHLVFPLLLHPWHHAILGDLPKKEHQKHHFVFCQESGRFSALSLKTPSVGKHRVMLATRNKILGNLLFPNFQNRILRTLTPHTISEAAQSPPPPKKNNPAPKSQFLECSVAFTAARKLNF